MSKRIPVHFDDEIVIVGDTYYYRGTPLGLKRRKEISLGIKVGAAQKDVLKAKKDKLANIDVIGTALGKNSFELVSRAYIRDREKEAENPLQLSPATLKETKQVMAMHLVPYFGRIRLEDIDQSRFTDYCELSDKKKLNLVNHLKVLNHFLKWCVRYKYLKYRAEIMLPKSARKERRKRVVLTDREVTAIIEAAEGKALLYILMYLLMGMRNMEICKLQWSDMDLKTGVLRIDAMSNRTRKERVIPIHPFVLKLLRILKGTAASLYVFPSARTNGKKLYMDPSGGIRKAWAGVLKKAKITRHITPHDLRATFETHMHLNPEFTDTQREKMAGAKIDVQKNRYVTMDARHLKGLENSVKVKGLVNIFKKKLGGIAGGKALNKKAMKSISSRKEAKK